MKEGQKKKVNYVLAAMLECFVLSAMPGVAAADVVIIDENVAGTLFDGLIDGFPGFAPFDGVADFAMNPLGVALKSGATEERGIVEFPLDGLAAFDVADIVAATLRFNIDDVVSTFGPGTAFDGTAAETIILFDYAGDGSLDLADFGNVAGAPLSIVDTTLFGVITDASLAASGPLFFDVDVTAAIQAHLAAGDTHMGIVFATDDDQTGTSLDNLGDGAAGPPGVNGASLPFLTMQTATGEPPVFGKSALKCQKVIASAGAKFVRTLHKELGKCLNAVLRAVAKGQDPSEAEAKCRKGLDVTDAKSKLAKANAKATDAIVGACSTIAAADIGSPCDSNAADAAAIAECVVADHQKRVEQAVRAEFADACDLLGAVNLDGGFNEVCLVQ